MGSFFQSIHVRSDAADAVEAAAHRVARKEGLKMLVAPARKGWVNVYPPTDNWLPRIAAALAKACKAEHAILFAVHDSDVLQYSYYRRGTLTAACTCSPDVARIASFSTTRSASRRASATRTRPTRSRSSSSCSATTVP